MRRNALTTSRIGPGQAVGTFQGLPIFGGLAYTIHLKANQWQFTSSLKIDQLLGLDSCKIEGTTHYAGERIEEFICRLI
jgi:hypothetical protein